MMAKMLQAAAGMLRLSNIAGNSDEMSAGEQLKATESQELKRLAQKACIYTKDYDSLSMSDESSKPCRIPEEKCIMPEECFKMFSLLRKKADECHKCGDGWRVVGLRYLCSDGSPRKWLDHVIFYSLGRRVLDIDDSVFIGVAIYSQYYGVDGEYREILIDNLLRLYIRGRILDKKDSAKEDIADGNEDSDLADDKEDSGNDMKNSFYNRIYTVDGENSRGILNMSLLEGMMRNALLMVLRVLKIPFSVEGDYLKTFVCDPYLIEEWFKKRDNDLTKSSEFAFFRDVIMERVPTHHISDDDKRIILALIGLIRTGRHVISIDCRNWVETKKFSNVLELVNTNRNLAGVAELSSSMDLDEELGEIKSQLKYLEITFEHTGVGYGGAIEFINSLDGGISIKASFHTAIDVLTMQELLDSPKVREVCNLRIEYAWAHLNNLNTDSSLKSLKSIASSPKLIDLEMHHCDTSLENFLANDDYKEIRDKLKVLEVSSVGDLRNEKITDAKLKSLRMEELHVRTYFREEVMDMNQLVSSGIITRDGFKHLVFQNIHYRNTQGIIALQNSLRQRESPAIITDFEPLGRENVDYTRICHHNFYELHTN